MSQLPLSQLRFPLAALMLLGGFSRLQPARGEAPVPTLPKVSNRTINEALGSEKQRFLYGESPEIGQLGQEYMVFETQADQVVGAFYRPASDYSCFSGTLTPDAMELNVQEPMTATFVPFSVPLADEARVATAQPQPLIGQSPNLSKSYPLALDTQSQQILQACKGAIAPQ